MAHPPSPVAALCAASRNSGHTLCTDCVDCKKVLSSAFSGASEYGAISDWSARRESCRRLDAGLSRIPNCLEADFIALRPPKQLWAAWPQESGSPLPPDLTCSPLSPFACSTLVPREDSGALKDSRVKRLAISKMQHLIPAFFSCSAPTKRENRRSMEIFSRSIPPSEARQGACSL